MITVINGYRIEINGFFIILNILGNLCSYQHGSDIYSGYVSEYMYS